ncbi:MAG TPA: hypothetical protein VMW35_09335 [Myxococcota bacterium]|jgi:hypothetical protein|nr:hypothetical protein [Myxococcota bacterium]
MAAHDTSATQAGRSDVTLALLALLASGLALLAPVAGRAGYAVVATASMLLAAAAGVAAFALAAVHTIRAARRPAAAGARRIDR